MWSAESVSISQSLGDCPSVKHRVSFTPFQRGCSSQHTKLKAAYACLMTKPEIPASLHKGGACSFSQVLIVLFS